MPKLVRLSTVEKLLRSLGHGGIADTIVSATVKPKKFNLHPSVVKSIEQRLARRETVAIRRGLGRGGIMFLNTEGFKPFNFQRPEIRAKAIAARRGVPVSDVQKEVASITAEASA